MSKVYEALRQKDLEVSTLPGMDPSSASDFSRESETVRHELGLSDRALQAVFLVGDEESEYRAEPQSQSETTSRPSEQVSRTAVDFPHLRLGRGDDSRLVFHTDPRGLAAEQYRLLRRNLEQKFPKGAVLLMTSPAPRDGKTLSAANLCSCLADSGRSTLLLECDLRQPSLRKLMRTAADSTTGIEAVLAGSAAPEAAVRFVEDLSVHVALVQTAPPNPSQLIRGAGMRNFLAWAREHFDWLVVDGPPIFPAADVAEISPLTDAVLMVVRARNTSRHLISKSVDLLGSRLFGVVLNEANVESNAYYQYLSDSPKTKSGPARTVPHNGNSGSATIR